MGEGDHNQSSGTTLNIFILVLTLALSGLTLFEVDKELGFDIGKLKSLIVISLVAVLLAVIVNWTFVNKYINKQLSKIKLLNAITFEYRKGFLEILDKNGKEVIYTEDCLIRKIKRRFIYEGNVNCSGTIDNEIQTFNCYSSLNNKKDELTIIYGKKRKKEADSLINKRQLQYGYAVTMHDSFVKKKESWDSIFLHYTKLYDLKMSFPKKHPPIYVDIFQIKHDGNGKTALHALPIDPLIINKKNKILVKIKLLHLEKNSKFRIVWKW